MQLEEITCQMQNVDMLHQDGKINNLQQIRGVFGCEHEYAPRILWQKSFNFRDLEESVAKSS